MGACQALAKLQQSIGADRIQTVSEGLAQAPIHWIHNRNAHSFRQYWQPFIIHKIKQRLTRLTQVAIRSRQLAKEEERLGEKLVPKLAPKIRRREETRERKAEAAAKVERAIERELIERLRSGAYGDKPLNVEEGIWKKVLKGLEREGEGVRDEDLDEGIEDEEECEQEVEEGLEDVQYVSDIEGEEEDDLGELEDWLGDNSGGERGSSDYDDDDDDAGEDSEASEQESGSEEDSETKKAAIGMKRKKEARSQKPRKKGPLVQIEYEHEQETSAPDREALAI